MSDFPDVHVDHYFNGAHSVDIDFKYLKMGN